MAKYEVTTETGKYLVETDEPSIQQPAEQPMTAGRYVAETAGNIIPNIGRQITGIAQAVRPIAQDIVGAGGMVNPSAPAIAAGKAAYRQFMPLVEQPQAAEQIRGQMVSGVKEAVKHPLNYIKENPVDAAMLVSGGLGVAGAGAKAAGLSRTAQLAMKASELVNPISIGLKGSRLAVSGTRLLSKSPARLMNEARIGYRTLLNPKKGDLQNIEIKSHKDINNSFNLAAKEKLPIESTPDKKISTVKAIEIVKAKQPAIHESVNSLLEKRPETINFEIIKTNVKKKLNETFKNADEYNGALRDVDDLLNAEIDRYGGSPLIKAKQANIVKQGMWSRGYNQLRPTTDKTARIIGHTIEEEINKISPEVRKLNSLSGQYSTLEKILANAHGNVIPGGRIGQYFIRGLSAISGAAAGQVVPVVGPIGGAMIGERIGAKIAKSLSSPERLSAKYAGKMTKAETLLVKKKPTISPAGKYPILKPPERTAPPFKKPPAGLNIIPRKLIKPKGVK